MFKKSAYMAKNILAGLILVAGAMHLSAGKFDSAADELRRISAGLFFKTVSEKLPRYSTKELYQLFSKKIAYPDMNVDPEDDSYLKNKDIIKIMVALQSPFKGHETKALQSLEAKHWMNWFSEILPIAREKLSRIPREKLSRIREQRVFEIIKRNLAHSPLISNYVAFCQAMQRWYADETGLVVRTISAPEVFKPTPSAAVAEGAQAPDSAAGPTPMQVDENEATTA